MGKMRTALTLVAVLCPALAVAQENYGQFFDLPIALENVPNGQGKPFRLTKELKFEDPNGTFWDVPSGGYTDGASIPWLFQIIVGDNYSGPYFPAAVIHDYYCCVQTHLAIDTHRNFYYGMLANGTPQWQAWLMYTAVRVGGPDWSEAQVAAAGDGSQCLDDVAPVPQAMVLAAPPAPPNPAMTMRRSAPNPMDEFVVAANRAQEERDTFVLSKLMAVAKTLKESDGKVIDVTELGQIPATFEGVEQLRSIVTRATNFSDFSTDVNRTQFNDFGLLVPIEGTLEQETERLREQGGLSNVSQPWNATELNQLGVATAALPERLPDTYLQDVARTTSLNGTGLEWSVARTPQVRQQWNRIIDADRSFRNWNNLRISPGNLPQ
ncbi:MAG: DUF1353 domain-containing protein [Rhizobiaceae bacterium]|nr:DUF1353 domain-containing protein [Rhizobiaceae bacterium]